MFLYLLYMLIILIVIILFIISKDRIILLGRIGRLSIIIGISIFGIGTIISIILFFFFNTFSINSLVNIILVKFIYNGLFFIMIGIFGLFICRLIKK